MRRSDRIVAVLAVSIAAASTAFASGEPAERRFSDSPFDALDRNADHRLSRSEAGFDRTLSRTFAQIDSNGDGYITPIEYVLAEQFRAMLSARYSSRPLAR
jgi:hypothetical protein